ncbi:SPOR domain-containing protein [Stenotrophomonas sp. C3(2023)]|uniref:SPOR domain-containing protein n=1 Tax=Stenotrophomonas sp. C3(2023) TaxID=3080277 RepID=UPI00293D13C0|nr:SPOR domain-containing protein [Stenotrophomonas sp. C3(2023)]MDV3469439.1 SPOR domain-containing protein [Stenotrophomonas sp. C3(2023)]
MDTSLKQRLIGAIVLVALAVIFLPMLVTGPARDSSADRVSISVPDAPANAQFETRELPLAAPTGGSTGLDAGAAPVQETPTSAPAQTSPSVAAGNYAVSFGAYASQAHADAVIAHLQRAQLPGFSEATTINNQPAWRVRVGPFADRAQAEAARVRAAQVRNDVKAEVVVLDAGQAPAAAAAEVPRPVAEATPAPASAAQTRPAASTPPAAAPTVAAAAEPRPEPKPEPKPAARAEPAPAAAPAAPAASGVGFAVQLGAFGKPADANALRDRMRAAGFSAFVEQVRTDKGVLNRVRVGPVASRNEADQLKAQLAARAGQSGIVVAHP